MSLTIHVSPQGSDSADGTRDQPLQTINRAAQLASAGDTVVVHAGEYREWVKPRRGGLSDQRRITYTAAPGEDVVIKGSERVTGWESEGGDVWKVEVPNALFGDFNPFAEMLDGDWAVYEPGASKKHLADVYLNGRSFYEAASRDEVSGPSRREHHVDVWTQREVATHEPDQTVFVWFAEVGEHATTLWANFQGADPNSELVEINVRRSVFYPDKHHLDWITVRGFEMAQAATPWAPPTADQPGLVGPNWAKGWIIEDNVIHDSKCSGISLGKEASTGDNYSTQRGDKPGYQYQVETVFAARRIGWDREHIGSHVVRGNTIFDCGQTGIVGHLGCVFSTIEDNHIHRIGLKREFFGHEIGGIKLHAAIDTQIRHNRIHDCSLGIWLDWQTQGTRISRNLLYRNNRDLFVEVSHGPYVVDHNLFGSAASLEVVSQGGAYVNNLVAGSVRLEPVMDRATPYHLPHSTQVAGFSVIAGGDDRWVGNVFLGGNLDDAYLPGGPHHETSGFGMSAYDDFPSSDEEFRARLGPPTRDHRRFHGVKQPAYIRSNGYAAGAEARAGEVDAIVVDAQVTVALTVQDDGDEVYVELDLPAALLAARVGVTSGRDLPPVRLVSAEFEDPDGTPVAIDVDLPGQHKDERNEYPLGPFAELPDATPGRLRVW
jgi:hypothetical protein